LRGNVIIFVYRKIAEYFEKQNVSKQQIKYSTHLPAKQSFGTKKTREPFLTYSCKINIMIYLSAFSRGVPVYLYLLT